MIGVAFGFPKHLPAVTDYVEMLRKNRLPDGASFKKMALSSANILK